MVLFVNHQRFRGHFLNELRLSFKMLIGAFDPWHAFVGFKFRTSFFFSFATLLKNLRDFNIISMPFSLLWFAICNKSLQNLDHQFP